ncbi:MAG: putative lipid II flippase FtsW [Candidatus Makaraimicrobium thalassicum]|nr:MAG: putative lipid II flippase FtsW [Candidatus Omnitrophota bacterium]
MNKDAKIVLLAVFMIIMIGIVMIYSASAVHAYAKYNDSMYFVKRHLLYLALGLIAAVLCMAAPAGRIAGSARSLMFFFIILLAAVLVPGIGKAAGGARRWMRFSGFGIQPSEMAKLALIVYLADWTSRKRHVIQNLRYGFLPPLFIIGLAGGLVLMEPDMGAFVSILFIGFVMLFVAGTRLRHLAFVTTGMLPVLALAVICEPYRIRRVLTFFNPWQDARGAGFQLIQSFIALGSGGFFGVGLGESKQKLFYLPESHTDFIFSIIGEELGFLGAASVLILFAVMIWFSLKISLKLRDRFASRVVLGISAMIAFDVIVNIGVSVGMLPTKGLPLSFISYGGSSLVCHLAAMGLLFNMARGVEQ